MATSTAPPGQHRPSGTLEPAPATAAPTAPALPGRLASLDAYRGFVMLLLLGEALRLCTVAAARPGSVLWAFLCHHQDHVEWVGGSLHDMIQPSFSLLVGVALPFSLASRTARGESRQRMIVHALWRALVLVLLGIWLRSVGRPQTYFTFEDTLTQIGLGYVFLFLLALRPVRDQWLALGLILLGYWAAFAAYPLPPPGFDYAAVGVPPDWPHLLTGFAAHWNKNSNLAWAFDLWFLNLFPRERPFLFNGGGYATLSFGSYQMIDVLGHRRWAFPLLVIGMNSIAAYCLHELFSRFVGEDLVRHLGDGMFGVFGDAYFPFLQGVMVVAALWLVLLWMWKRQIFLRI
jgi:heparan-alpha-glucosaminide N-acetyltransferase